VTADRPPSRRAFLTGAATGLAAIAGACSSTRPANGARATTTASTTTWTSSTTTTTSDRSVGGQASGSARFVSTGPTTSDAVALTFHTDGDLTVATELLDALARHHVHATLFIVGRWLQAHPDWGKRFVDAGHEVANHTYNHRTFHALSAVQMRDEVDRCRDVLLATTGSPGAFFRPSGTEDGVTSPSPAVLEAAAAGGYATVLGYDVDPHDYQDPGTAAVVSRTSAALHPGAIVSLHFGHPGTVAAIDAIVGAIGARGLRAVTAGQLLAGG
jgi:peptidoglycan/xylan/chitin deacetylase (PgdA/CDA1 family)